MYKEIVCCCHYVYQRKEYFQNIILTKIYKKVKTNFSKFEIIIIFDKESKFIVCLCVLCIHTKKQKKFLPPTNFHCFHLLSFLTICLTHTKKKIPIHKIYKIQTCTNYTNMCIHIIQTCN